MFTCNDNAFRLITADCVRLKQRPFRSFCHSVVPPIVSSTLSHALTLRLPLIAFITVAGVYCYTMEVCH